MLLWRMKLLCDFPDNKVSLIGAISGSIDWKYAKFSTESFLCSAKSEANIVAIVALSNGSSVWTGWAGKKLFFGISFDCTYFRESSNSVEKLEIILESNSCKSYAIWEQSSGDEIMLISLPRTECGVGFKVE